MSSDYSHEYEVAWYTATQQRRVSVGASRTGGWYLSAGQALEPVEVAVMPLTVEQDANLLRRE